MGVHEELGVGMDGDEGLEVSVGLDEVHHVADLHFGVGRGAVVQVGAGVSAGAGAWVTHAGGTRALLKILGVCP